MDDYNPHYYRSHFDLPWFLQLHSLFRHNKHCGRSCIGTRDRAPEDFTETHAHFGDLLTRCLLVNLILRKSQLYCSFYFCTYISFCRLYRTRRNGVLGAQTARHLRCTPEPPVAGSESIFSTLLKLLVFTWRRYWRVFLVYTGKPPLRALERTRKLDEACRPTRWIMFMLGSWTVPDVKSESRFGLTSVRLGMHHDKDRYSNARSIPVQWYSVQWVVSSADASDRKRWLGWKTGRIQKEKDGTDELVSP